MITAIRAIELLMAMKEDKYQQMKASCKGIYEDIQALHYGIAAIKQIEGLNDEHQEGKRAC